MIKKFILIIDGKYRFNLTPKNYQEVIRDQSIVRSVTYLLYEIERQQIWAMVMQDNDGICLQVNKVK